MAEALIIGSAVGTILGLLHAAYVFSRRVRDAPERRLQASYFALWTLLLWILFGACVFYLWLLSGLIYAVWYGVRRPLKHRAAR